MNTVTLKKEDVQFMKDQFTKMVEELNKKDLQIAQNKKDIQTLEEKIEELEKKLVPSDINDIISQETLDAISRIQLK